MEYYHILAQSLPTLPPRMRVAFATACAERVRLIYEFLAESEVEAFDQVLAQLWAWVANGTALPDGPTDARVRLTAKFQAFMDDEESGSEVNSLRTLLLAIDACSDPTTESSEDAAFSGVQTASGSSVNLARSRQARAEEERFQLAVLDIVRAWQGPEFDMKMFEPVGWTAEHGWPTAEWVEQYRTNPKW